MKNDIFISFHPEDKSVAAEIGKFLGASTIAHTADAAEVSAAIDVSKILVLVHSNAANFYEPIAAAVRHAVAGGKKVILFRLEETPLSEVLSAAVGEHLSVNAFTPPMEPRIQQLLAKSQTILKSLEAAGDAAERQDNVKDNTFVLGIEPVDIPANEAPANKPVEHHQSTPIPDSIPMFIAGPPQAVSSFSDGLNDLRKSQSIDPPARLGIIGHIDHYEVLRKIGEGGMGVVLLANDTKTSQQVAIKSIKPSYVGNDRAQHRFATEAKHMQRMNHPHILRVLEVCNRPNGAYYVMPYISGGSLAAKIDPAKPMEVRLFLKIARQIADALRYAHDETGVIHRDIKPENVLLDASENAYLSDFGLLRTVFNDTLPDNHQVSWTVGTRPYMAPEIVAGKAGDTRADIYSFGAMLFEMATGRPPYLGDSAEEVMTRIKMGPPPGVREINSHFPLELAAVIESAMGRELRNRYAHMADLLADLERAENGIEPIGPHDIGRLSVGGGTTFEDEPRNTITRRRRPSILSGVTVIIAVLVAVAGIGAYLQINRPVPPPAPRVVAAIEWNDVAALKELIRTHDFSKAAVPQEGSFIRQAMKLKREEQALILLSLITDPSQFELTDEAGDTLLHLAARQDLPGVIRQIHKSGARIDVPHRDTHETPLSIAVSKGNAKAAAALTGSGAKPLPLMAAPEAPAQMQNASALPTVSQSPDTTPRGNVLAAQIPAPVVTGAVEPIASATRPSKVPVDVAALRQAIVQNDISKLGSLIANHDFSSVDLAAEDSPIRLAIKRGREDHALALLATIEQKQFGVLDPAGDSLLDLAAIHDLPAVIKRMHLRGAVIDSRHADNQQTPLYLAVFHRKRDAVAALVECGADPHLKTGRNKSPAELAEELDAAAPAENAGQLVAALSKK